MAASWCMCTQEQALATLYALRKHRYGAFFASILRFPNTFVSCADYVYNSVAQLLHPFQKL